MSIWQRGLCGFKQLFRAVFRSLPVPVIRAFVALNAILWAATALNNLWLPLILPDWPRRDLITLGLVCAGVVLFFLLIARWALRDGE